MRVSVALAVGLVLLAVALGMTLSKSPVLVIRTSATQPAETLAETDSDAGACQGGEVLPAGTSAIRLSLQSVLGPRVSVTALSGSRLLTSGVAGSGWTGGNVTVRVKPLVHTISGVRICFRLGPTKEKVAFMGWPTNAAMAARSREGKALIGRMRIEDLRADSGSWWSAAPSIARRMGLGGAPGGAWVVLLLLALMSLVVAGASRLAFRELR